MYIRLSDILLVSVYSSVAMDEIPSQALPLSLIIRVKADAFFLSDRRKYNSVFPEWTSPKNFLQFRATTSDLVTGNFFEGVIT